MIVDIDGLPIEEAESGLTELARLGSSVMVLGTVNDVNYFRRIMRTGARDYLIKPVDADMPRRDLRPARAAGRRRDAEGPRRRHDRRPRRRRRDHARDQRRLHHGREALAPHRARRHGHLCRQHRARARHRPDPRPARGARRPRARRRDLPAERDGEVRQEPPRPRDRGSLRRHRAPDRRQGADARRHHPRQLRHGDHGPAAPLHHARAGALHPLRRRGDRDRAHAAGAARHQPADEADERAQPPGQGARHRQPGRGQARRHAQGVRGGHWRRRSAASSRTTRR